MKPRNEGKGHGEEKGVSAGDVYERIRERREMPGLSGKTLVAGWVCVPQMRLPPCFPVVQWPVPMRRVPLANLSDSGDGAS